MTGSSAIINATPGTAENAAKLCLEDVVAHWSAIDAALVARVDATDASEDDRRYWRHERKAWAKMHVRAAMALDVVAHDAAFEVIK